MRDTKAFIRAINFGVSMLLVLAAIAIAYIAIPAFGNKALIVRSGSMQPAIGVGDLVVVQKQYGFIAPQNLTLGKYRAGDVIAFSSEKNSKLFTTHRIVGKEIKDGKVFYQTKGDANNAADNNLVAEENVIGKSTFQLPYFGRLFAFAKSNIGFPLLVIFPALLVIILEITNIVREVRKSKNKTPKVVYQKTVKVLYAHYGKPMGLPHPSASFRSIRLPRFTRDDNIRFNFRAVLPILISFLLIGNSSAYFSDAETSTNNTFTASESFPHLVINEVFYFVDENHKGSGAQSNWEWVELYNPTSSTIVITGWTIEDDLGSDSLPGTTSIPSGAYVIVSPSSESELKDPSGGNWVIPGGTLFIEISGATIGSGFDNGGDRVILKNNTGAEVDRMSWGTNTSGFTSGCAGNCPNVSSGHSLERNPDGFDTNAAGDFVNRTIPTPGS